MTKGFRRIHFSGAHAPTSSAAPVVQPKRGGSTSARSTFRGAGPSGSHTGGGSIRPSTSPPVTRPHEEGDARERKDAGGRPRVIGPDPYRVADPDVRQLAAIAEP